MLKCLILQDRMYECEAWTLRKKEEDKLKAAEMWLYRQLLSIRWQDKKNQWKGHAYTGYTEESDKRNKQKKKAQNQMHLSCHQK
ncbi:endonuclease-reverse transcriptase [Elysia marginata]|uniref:Endonuclease-reverse transcriptase n=1 Tax=Elysia marginata TaxID=1093978 RepID=A0AAV4F203_9GAST|nr:endonuclease-reverse transcriptase [Elysia marginata]